MVLNYCLLITSPAYGGQRASVAFQFAQTLLKCGHRIIMIFFYHEGVYNASKLSIFAADEINLTNLWCDLAKKNHIELGVCISAAMHRGIISKEQAIEVNFLDSSLQKSFKLSGLGSLVKAIIDCDRLVKF